MKRKTVEKKMLILKVISCFENILLTYFLTCCTFKLTSYTSTLQPDILKNLIFITFDSLVDCLHFLSLFSEWSLFLLVVYWD